MPKSIFIDTNILIDAAVPDREHHAAAILLENEVAYSGLKSYIAATTLKDVYYLIKGESDEAFAREYIQCLMKLYQLAAVDAFICTDAVESDEPDFEDGIVRSCAELLGVEYIISRDEKAFRNSPIKRLTAEEYIDKYVELEEINLSE